MKSWKRLEPTTVTKVGFRTVVTKTFKLNSGKTFTFDTYDVEGREYVLLISIDQLFINAREGLMTDTVGVLLAYDELKRRAAR